MRKEDMAFAYLEPNLELYKARTGRDDKLPHRCAFGHRIEPGAPFRALFFRERGWAWKGKRIYLICAEHYAQATGKRLKPKA